MVNQAVMDGLVELTPLQSGRGRAACTHGVCFFRDDEYPVERIAAHVQRGVLTGGAIVFASPRHLTAIQAALTELGTDVAACLAAGRLWLGDAEVAARAIVSGGTVWQLEFDYRVRAGVERIVEQYGRVCAYGEIVDVLARAGDARGAVELERWWNQLLAQFPLELLCGYGLESFAAVESTPAFRQVCDEHHAVELSWAQRVFDDDRVAAELNQAVAALQTEVTRRQQVQGQQELLRADIRAAQNEARTATEHLARLQHFTSALSEATSVEAINQVAIAELESTFQADVAALALEDGDGLRLISGGSNEHASASRAAVSVLDGQSPMATACRNAEPIWLTNPRDIARDYPKVLAAQPAAHSFGAVPLIVRGRRLGALGVLYLSADRAPQSMRALIDDYARQVALALDRALAHDAAQAVSERLQLLADATARIAQAKLDLRQVVDALVREVTRAGFAQRCTVDLRAADGNVLITQEGGLPDEEPAVSSVVVPLHTTLDVIGSLTAVRHAGRPTFSSDDKHLLRELADRASLCIENAMLYERARDERERTECERTRAEAANRAKDEFLAMLGHELRNPLSPIRTAVHLMRLRSPGLQVRERTIIERQVNHMVRLVDDLLDVSRIARGKVELKRASIDLSQVVADAVEIASPLLEARAHELRTALPPEPLIVFGDASRLAQVVANLLTNAAKYTPAHGRIEIEASESEGRVALVVRDNGNGIEPGLLPRLFDLFMQGKQASDRAEGGLGLGLAIARNLVEMHGGTLRATSAGTGLGSAFTLELPQLEQTAVPSHAGTDSAAVSTHPAQRRVLVVDDNADAADLICDALQGAGHRVCVAYDGPSALQLAGDFRPELALLDIGLPVMDGYELGRRLVTLAGCESVRLVALTGYGQTGDRQRSREAGFDEHLVKPIDLERVLAVLERL